MAKEKFSVIAIEETSNWDQALLEEHGIEAAFGYYLTRDGEATHICSFTPSSWCVWIRNEFVYDADNEAAHEWAGDNMGEGGESDYFGYMTPDTMDPRFICERFTISDIKAGDYKGGVRSDGYHDAIWEAAEEAARELDCNGMEAPIIYSAEYARYQAELAAARRAENRPVLRRGYGGDDLPLFVAAANATGIDSWEKAREIGWL